MGYVVSARKWRPQTFDEIIGQHVIVNALKSEISNGRIAHAYMFTGPRGVGKTSAARILAKALNCINGPTTTPCNECANCKEITSASNIDVIEIDGASNNSVNEAREVIEEVRYLPSKSTYKIYIIDEFHMLSNSAFNALLKTLEEPPPHAVFITATTEPHKVIATIKSRMKVFNFVPLSMDDIKTQIVKILDNAKLKYEEDALFYIAKSAEGGMRDALSILDVVMSITDEIVTTENVISILGVPKEEIYFRYIENLIYKDAAGMIETLHDISRRGENLSQFAYGLLEFFRHILIIKKITQAPVELVPLSHETKEKLFHFANQLSEKQILDIFNELIELNNDLKNSVNAKFLFEQYSVKLSRYDSFMDLSDILKKLESYEEKYKKYGSIEIKTELTNRQETAATQSEKKTIPITENFYQEFLNHINPDYKTLIAALTDARHVIKDNLNNGEILIIFNKQYIYEDFNNTKKGLLSLAENEFLRIFGKKIKIMTELEMKSDEEMRDHRKKNVAMLDDLFGASDNAQ